MEVSDKIFLSLVERLINAETMTKHHDKAILALQRKIEQQAARPTQVVLNNLKEKIREEVLQNMDAKKMDLNLKPSGFAQKKEKRIEELKKRHANI